MPEHTLSSTRRRALTQRELEEVVRRVRPMTMVGDASLLSLAHQVNYVLEWDIPGDFVECGVWRGGASFLMADILRRLGISDRRVWLFDSFAGLPVPEAIDGKNALDYAQDTERVEYFDNCTATYEEVEAGAGALGLAAHTELVKGWFEETLPIARARLAEIALLRIDCDWYAGTRCVLENLYPLVSEGGFVALDDYYAYEGCTLAVHEFLVENALPHRLESVVGLRRGRAYSETAYFRKVTDTSAVVRRPLEPTARLSGNISVPSEAE